MKSKLFNVRQEQNRQLTVVMRYLFGRADRPSKIRTVRPPQRARAILRRILGAQRVTAVTVMIMHWSESCHHDSTVLGNLTPTARR